MKLVACQNCHAQYDVTGRGEQAFDCHCGQPVEARSPVGQDRAVCRCAACGALLEPEAERCAYCRAEVPRDPRQNTQICPECFARGPETSHYCVGCGVAFQPQPLPQDMRECPCPDCGCLMPGRALGAVALHECPSCAGLWIPGEQFDALIQRAVQARRERGIAATRRGASAAQTAEQALGRSGVRYRKCPVCEAFMLRRNYARRSGIVIDVCSKHGTWLDADELEQIGEFILGGGLASAEAAEAAQRQERERRERVSASAASASALSRPLHRPDDSKVGWVVELLTSLLS